MKKMMCTHHPAITNRNHVACCCCCCCYRRFGIVTTLLLVLLCTPSSAAAFIITNSRQQRSFASNKLIVSRVLKEPEEALTSDSSSSSSRPPQLRRPHEQQQQQQQRSFELRQQEQQISRDFAKNGQQEIPQKADYILQTEDFSVIEQQHQQHQRQQQRNNGPTTFDVDGLLQDVRNLRVPQIHLPPRLMQPNVGLAYHHQATLNLVHDAQRRGFASLPFSKGSSSGEREPSSPLVSATREWERLQTHATQVIAALHLRDLLQDAERCNSMYAVTDDGGIYLDYSRQRVTQETMQLLFDLAQKQNLKGKMQAMVRGDAINFTEKRAVLHTALRAKRSEIGTVMLQNEEDGSTMDVVQEVHEVLDQIKEFTQGVRSGAIRGYTGKRLRNIVSVGIGGSYLGPEFLHECLKTEPEGVTSALGYNLRFLANVDPVDVERTCADLDPEETLVVVVSKTFTTAETMLNARTMRQWLWDFMGNDKEVVRKHMVACASLSSKDKVAEFGIDTEKRFFRFWDFVGGRYSVCSAAGAVPISLLYGFDLFEKFLDGAHSIDQHFMTAPFEKNIPVLMGLLGVWNMSFMKYKARTTLPYAEALLKLPAHIQQLDMESNGKCMTKHGLEVDYDVGEIDFGEAGTNGQHSFYQLLHMGQTVPCEFIGFVQSQHDFCVEGESLSSHDELMANFFAQPDALANGKTVEEVRAEGVPEDSIGHRVFKGNRPSLSLLLPKLTAYATGQLLALYEHRTAVQGFIWDINSFDQWGVELGKKLAMDVKEHMLKGRQEQTAVKTHNPATTRLLNYYLENGQNVCQEDSSQQHSSVTRVTRKTHREHANPPPPIQHDLGRHGGKL
jgi:glucose-6-phosphate isomerase